MRRLITLPCLVAGVLLQIAALMPALSADRGAARFWSEGLTAHMKVEAGENAWILSPTPLMVPR